MLVIDDVTDTEDTLTEAISYIRRCGATEIRTAVPQHKDTSGFLPDYYAERITKCHWIIYPWAVYEDISGFVLRILKKGHSTAERIFAAPTEDFSINVDAGMVSYICADLIRRSEAEERGGRIQIPAEPILQRQYHKKRIS